MAGSNVPARLNVEVMHLYGHELARPKIAREAARIACAYVDRIPVVPHDRTICALIDDYGSDMAFMREEAAEALIWYAAQEDVHVDFVGFESDCEKEADRLLEQAGIPEADGDGLRHFTRETKESSTTVLVRNEEYVACPTLAAVWVLARLGVPNYNVIMDLYGPDGIRMPDGFACERLFTILPLKYMRTEATVYDLLRQTGHDVVGRMTYAFH